MTSMYYNGTSYAVQATKEGVAPYGSAVIDDVDGDGDIEIFIARASIWLHGLVGQVRAFDHVLNQKWIKSDIGRAQDLKHGDIDFDGKVEILVGTFDASDDNTGKYSGRIWIYDTSGSEEWESDDLGAVDALALGDFDGDGKLDIAAGVTPGDLDDPWETIIFVFDGQTHERIGKFLSVGYIGPDSFLPVDTNGDGRYEVLIGYIDNEKSYIILVEVKPHGILFILPAVNEDRTVISLVSSSRREDWSEPPEWTL